MLSRFQAALRWRLVGARDDAADLMRNALARRGGASFIRWRWPAGRTKPFERRTLLLHPPGVGIGDNLMCTPVLREIKRRNPGCEITFLTRYPELFRDNPDVDHVETDLARWTSRAVRLRYDHLAPRIRSFQVPGVRIGARAGGADRQVFYDGYVHATPPDRPLISILAECVGMEFHATQLECAVPQVSAAFAERIAAIPRPFVVVQPQASAWTPNKNWPVPSWDAAVRALLPHAAIVEVGTQGVLTGLADEPRFIPLAGATSVSELLYVIRAADVFVGPDSGGMHVANAFRVPSVVIFGGYSAPDSFGYPRTIAITGATTLCALLAEHALPVRARVPDVDLAGRGGQRRAARARGAAGVAWPLSIRRVTRVDGCRDAAA